MRCQNCGSDRVPGERTCSDCGETSPGGRLSALDASFLHLERPNEPLNVGLSGVYEGGLECAEVVQAVRACLARVPRLGQRVVFAPLALAQPAWERAADFDPADHVEERVVRPPGNERAFAEAAGEVMAEGLDRSRPLWRIVLLHGLAGGNTGLVLVLHHAMADLLSCFDVAVELHRSSEAESATASQDRPPAGEARPGAVWQAAADRVTELAGWSLEGLTLMADPVRAGRIAKRMIGVARSGTEALREPPPATPFNGQISPGRDSAWTEISLGEVEAVREVLGGTLNDVALAVIGGALRTYLLAHGWEVEGVVLRLLCPASLRKPEESGSLGNRISWLDVRLDLGIEDPVVRARACREAMESGKRSEEALGRDDWMKLVRWQPPGWQAVAGRLAEPSGNFNSIATNVRGPERPLFLAGHRALVLLPWAPLASGMGLIHAIGSYDGRLFVNAVVDPALVPEPWKYADLLRASFSELRLAASLVVK